MESLLATLWWLFTSVIECILSFLCALLRMISEEMHREQANEQASKNLFSPLSETRSDDDGVDIDMTIPTTGLPTVAVSAEQVAQEVTNRLSVAAGKVYTVIDMEAAIRKKQHRLENEQVQEQMQALSKNSAHDAAFEQEMEKRCPLHHVALSTEKERSVQAEKLASQYIAGFRKAVKAEMDSIKAVQDVAKEAKMEAEEKQKQATKAMNLLDPEHASKVDIDMVKSSEIDIDKLAETAAMSGKYVWAWMEDKYRFGTTTSAMQQQKGRKLGSTSDPVIPYDEPVWARIEAHYLAFKAGAGSKYASFEVEIESGFQIQGHPGTSHVAHQTSQLYTINIVTMKQRNKSSGYERQIRRIAVEELAGVEKGELLQNRATALRDAEQACSESVKATRRAGLEEHRAALLVERAQERWNGTEYPDASNVVGHEQIPMSWSPMGNKLYLEVKLSDSDTEYEKVARYFTKTNRRNKILSITRIQNVHLWHMYDRTRRLMSKSKLNNGNPNEEYLWHGSKRRGGLEKILVGGFDSSLASKSHTPKGIWLSTNSEYSASMFCYKYNPCDTKKILLVRSVLGYIGQIQSGQSHGVQADSHHCGGTSVGHVRKDDQVGRGSSYDNRYIINKNNQIYPAYVIHFQD